MKNEGSERVGEFVKIYKRGENYSATMQYRSRQLRRSLKTNNIKAARRLALAWEAQVLGGSTATAAQQKPPAISKVVELLLAACEAEGRAEKTLTKYRGIFNRVLELSEELHLDDISQIDFTFIDEYRRRRREAGKKPKTIYTEVAIIRQLAKFAKTRRLIQVDPLEGLKNPAPKGKPQPFWTHQQMLAIFATAKEPQRTIYTFLGETGVRIGEAQWLTWDDIDETNGVIHIRPKEGWTTKTGNIRAVPMNAIVKKLLTSLLREARWVFTAPASAKYPSGDHQISERRLLKSLKRTLAKLDLPGHLHTFRHSFISRAIFEGTAEAVVRSWVGHVDEETIRIYTHIANKQSKEAMQRLHDGLYNTDLEKLT